MSRATKWLKKEFFHILPAVLYFFIAFNIFYMTFGWIFRALGLPFISYIRTVIGALIIGKVMLVADKLPFLNIFSRRPLIYSTAWKTSIYFLFTFLFRMLEHLVPFVVKYKDLDVAWRHLIDEIWWPRFWTVQIWLAVLLLLFVVSQEVIKAVGREKIREMFFGR